MPANSKVNTVANQANARAQARGYKEGFKKAREGWALWHSRLPVPFQVLLSAYAVSPQSVSWTQHKNGSLTIKVVSAPSK